MDEVLQPRTRQISCIYSDIRNFTKSTKSTTGFIESGVIPNVRACTSAIEDNHGIPKKVGDLVFAYFDHANRYVNLLRCLKAGCQLLRTNSDFNEATETDFSISRHVLVASGEAVVGNLGGLDSSVEITALGSPVNFLARVDELTKEEALSRKLNGDFLLLSNTSKLLLDDLALPFTTTCFDLKQNGLTVRDFGEATCLWLVPVNDETDFVLDQALTRVSQVADAAKQPPN